jgi:5-methylthioadenosine/S-adenosylhomocysteine deaminase
MAENTLIRADFVLTLNDEGEILRPGYIGFSGGTIRYVSATPPAGTAWRTARRIDGAGCIALPGLINAHTHVGMTVMRNAADDLPLMAWLEQKVWPMEARMAPEDRYWAAQLAALEQIRGGVTCFCDMSPDSDQVAQAVQDTGIRAVLSEVLLETQDPRQERLQRSVEIAREWEGKGDGRIRFSFGPHALYTCSVSYLEKVLHHAAELDLPVQIHVSETEDEITWCRKRFSGRTPVAVLDDIGLFSRPTLAAHCIHLEDKDREILAERGVTAVHNPASNLKLAAGCMDVPALLAQGVNVALGTDSAASNNNLSILNEMRLTALVQKGQAHDPGVLPAEQVLRLAMRNGAQAIGMADRLGRLQPGYAADIVLIRNDGVHAAPTADPVSQLVYSLYPGDVDTVFVAGEMLLSGGKFLHVDEEEVKAKAGEISARIRV